jgi:C4-type Zn-finger protein
MEIWCPECNNTTFYYSLVSTAAPTEGNPLIYNDHMKCKKCGNEFDITWYQYVREGWIESQPRTFRKRTA